MSDGTLASTRIVNRDSGEPLEGVTRLDWHIGQDSMLATVTLDIINVHVQLAAEGEATMERMSILPPQAHQERRC